MAADDVDEEGGCRQPCCDVSTSKPARLEFKKELSGVDYTVGGSTHKRYFLESWLSDFPWLVLCISTYKAFCHICRQGYLNCKLKIPKGQESTYLKTGFSDWKNGKRSFTSHEKSQFHRDSYNLLSESTGQGPLLKALGTAQMQRKRCLFEYLENVRLLARQGLAYRREEECQGNLMVLLQNSQRHIEFMKTYIHESKYLSHDILSEVLELFYRQVMEWIMM